MGGLFYDIGQSLGSFFDDNEYAREQKRIAAEQAEQERRGHEASNAALSQAYDDFLAGAVGGAPVANAAPMPTPPPPAPAFPGQPTWTPRNEVLKAEPSRPAGDTSRSTMDEMLAEINGSPAPSVGFSWAGGARPTTNSTLYDPVTQNRVMGRESIGGGGFSPSQMDWSKVANPLAFEAFREEPVLAARQAAIEKARADEAMSKALREDPFASERTKAQLESEIARDRIAATGAIQRGTEMERRSAFGAEMQAETARLNEALRATFALPDDKRAEAETALIDNYNRNVDAIRAKYGIGARMSSGSLFERSAGEG